MVLFQGRSSSRKCHSVKELLKMGVAVCILKGDMEMASAVCIRDRLEKIESAPYSVIEGYIRLKHLIH
jgi:hypothetical protein